jgi:hypothetical protein
LQGRSSDVEFASNEFEFYIQQAMEATQAVIATDPERGAELSKLVSQALLDYAVTLKSVLLEAPDPIKPVVEKALLFSQDSAGDEIEIFGIVESISEEEVGIDGEIYLITDLTEFKDQIEIGDPVKVHVILTTEETMIIREIELASDFDDDSDDFGDDNSNNDDASPDDNDNSNDNDDGNENESDDNENDNESEDNDNDNESDDNENDSEDNENDNESNENEDEDDSESNVNENESEDDEIETKSEDDENENDSEDNEEESEDNENEHESDENDNENKNESDEEEEEEDKENDD